MFNSQINKYTNWREHDQKYFISDNTKLKQGNYWRPEISFKSFVETENNTFINY
jgi:hypothetical protein